MMTRANTLSPSLFPRREEEVEEVEEEEVDSLCSALITVEVDFPTS